MIEHVLIHVKEELEGQALCPVICEIMDSWYESGYRQEWFAHPSWHLWYVMEGKAQVGLAGSEVSAEEGDLFLIPGGTLHSLVIPEGAPCRFFDAKFLFAGEHQGRRISKATHLHDSFGMRYLIDRVIVELERQAPAWETAVRGLFNELVGEVTRRLATGRSDPAAASPSAVRKAIAYVEENYPRPIQLEDVAAHVAFSPKYLATLFKRATGYTVKEFVTHARIRRAKWFLANSDLSVKEVADRVGYSSIHYFSRVFRAMVGAPPSIYRKHQRG